MNKIKLIGISGNARCGKDSLYLILESILKQHNIETERFALADILKLELNEFTSKHFNISSYTSNQDEKKLIRGMMVEFGKIKRIKTNGTYWINNIDKNVKDSIKEGNIPIITDIRYTEYPKDENTYIRENSGVIVYIERLLADGSIVPPANKEEEVNNEKLKKQADYLLFWQTTDNMDLRTDYVKLQLKDLIKRLIDEKNN